MTLVADGERAGIGRDEAISISTIMRGAAARLVRGGWRVVVLWLVIFGVSAVADRLEAQFAIEGTLFEPAYWGYLAVTMGLGAILGGLTTRLMIAGKVDWLRLDRGLVEYAIILLATSLAFAGIGAGFAEIASDQYRAPEGGAQTVLWLSLAVLALYAAGLYVWFRLSLWPVARLLGRRDMTPAKAWPLMRRAMLSLVLSYGIAGLPILALLAGTIMTGDGPGTTNIPSWVERFAIASWGVVTYGMVATVYELRLKNPATVAAIFD